MLSPAMNRLLWIGLINCCFCLHLAIAQEDAKQQAPAQEAEEKKATTEQDDAKSKEVKEEEKNDADETLDEVLPGHSAHGEAFNAGARQKARLMEGCGNVHIEITCKNAEVQKFFDQGLGQLHGFWYLEAERSFRHAASLEPECAMLYWGMAMSNFSNSKRATEFIDNANKYKSKASKREQLWIDGLSQYLKDKGDKKVKYRNLIKSFENIVHDYPDELEAKAFLAWAIWSGNRNGQPISSYEAVSSVIDRVLAEKEFHPVHHYKIHLWDYEKSSRALESAARCGQSAPNIAHMWHMPGHIYSRLKRYDDAAWQQEASARTDHKHMIADHVMPYEIHNFAHNNEWCIRNLINLGRVQDALSLSKNMVELPRHPKKNDPAKRGSGSAYGRTRLYQVLATFEMWKEVLELKDSVYLESTDDQEQQIEYARLIGAANYSLDNPSEGDQQLTVLQEMLTKKEADIAKAVEEAEAKAKKEKKSEKLIKKAADSARKSHSRALGKIQEGIQELELRQALASGDTEKALKMIPKLKGPHKSNIAKLYLAAGNIAEAEKTAKQAVDSGKNEAYPLATYIEVLHHQKKTNEVKSQFQQFKKLASQVDMELPAFARMNEIAHAINEPENWKPEFKFAKDVGARPELDSLGPFRWTPFDAPRFELPNAEGKIVSSDQFKGRPVLVICYLGYGCLHCVEQLTAFSPMAKEFDSAGIQLLAISTDSVKVLDKSIEACGREEGFPFPLLSDESLKSFKDFKAYDDFEKTPLHGTFLIDGKGKIRWQDISYEPFTDPKFLLKESKRLLAQ